MRDETMPEPPKYSMQYPVTNEQMRRILSNWPMKGDVVQESETYDPTTGGDMPMDFDEYGNYWVYFECLNVPPKLPVSVRKLRPYLQGLMREMGLNPARLMDFHEQYIDEASRTLYRDYEILLR